MGFIFPGDTSPHGTGFSYASRGWFLSHPSCTGHRASLPMAGAALLSHPGKGAEGDPHLLILLPPPHLTGVHRG